MMADGPGVAWLVPLLLLLPSLLVQAAPPQLSPPVWNAGPTMAQFTLANCSDTNVQYVVQMSTNLTDWNSVAVHGAATTNFSVSVATSGPLGFYRVVGMVPPMPLSGFGIFCKTYFDMSGNNCTVDSFDSSVGNGQWSTAVRKANGNLGANIAVTNSLFVGNMNDYGYIYTGVGIQSNAVQMGHNGSVGDLNWVNGGNPGIQSNHWIGNYLLNVPDVTAPNTVGWKTALPAATNGVITLNGGNYAVSSLLNPLMIAGNTMLWVQGSLSLGVSFTNNARLILYVGRTSGTGDSLSWSGTGTMNVPGYATDFQIYGLPSLISVRFQGNAPWIATLYAPEANVTAGGGGNNTQDVSGAIIANSIKCYGRWNFHYDEYLAVVGPHF